MRLALVTLACLSLCACGESNDPTNGPDLVFDNVVRDVSFKAQHIEERTHAKGSSEFVTVPDAWYVHLCNVKSADDCFYHKINHAPWDWETVNTVVTTTWQQRTYHNTVKSLSVSGKLVDF